MESLLVHSVAGTLAGLIEATIMQPLDTLKTRYQARPEWTSLKMMISSQKTEGFKGLYKGYIPVCSVLMPKVAIQFTGLAYFKSALKEHPIFPEYATTVVAGIATGVVQAVTVLTPFELLKVRQQTEAANGHHYRNQWSAIQYIVKKEGWRGMYTGLSATIARQSWGLVVKFTGYEVIKSSLHKYYGLDDDLPTPVLYHTIAGGLTNVIVAVVNSPPDVVKTRMQDSSQPSLLLRQCLQVIYKEEGLAGFFKGSILRILRIAPGGAIQFGAYGYFSNCLHEHFDL